MGVAGGALGFAPAQAVGGYETTLATCAKSPLNAAWAPTWVLASVGREMTALQGAGNPNKGRTCRSQPEGQCD